MVYVSAIGLLTKRDDPILLIVGLHHFGIITSPVQVRDSELRYHADPLVFIVHPVLHSRPNNIVIRQQLQKLRLIDMRSWMMCAASAAPRDDKHVVPPPQDANFSRKLQPQIVHTVHLFVAAAPLVSDRLCQALLALSRSTRQTPTRAEPAPGRPLLTSAMVRSIAVGAVHIHTSVGGNVL